MKPVDHFAVVDRTVLCVEKHAVFMAVTVHHVYNRLYHCSFGL